MPETNFSQRNRQPKSFALDDLDPSEIEAAVACLNELRSFPNAILHPRHERVARLISRNHGATLYRDALGYFALVRVAGWERIR